tara:strand:- start:296 stop:643 length:348 start_codon:yes stop_codon:yes gene_type:complete
VVVAVEVLIHHMPVPQVDPVVVAEVIEQVQPEETALVIHSQAHLEPHLQTDGDILVEMLRTQVLVAVAVVPVVMVVMVTLVVMEDPVEQVFNFLQHIEIHSALWDSLDQVVVDIG